MAKIGSSLSVRYLGWIESDVCLICLLKPLHVGFCSCFIQFWFGAPTYGHKKMNQKNQQKTTSDAHLKIHWLQKKISFFKNFMFGHSAGNFKDSSKRESKDHYKPFYAICCKRLGRFWPPTPKGRKGWEANRWWGRGGKVGPQNCDGPKIQNVSQTFAVVWVLKSCFANKTF